MLLTQLSDNDLILFVSVLHKFMRWIMVSSKDVAKKAGVSQSTVSRVINNPESVSKVKRDKVESVMKELNYIPNSIARSLISNKTNQISLISGTLNNPFFVEATRTIVNAAYKKGFTVNVFFEEDVSRENLYKTVFSQKAEGIILSSMYYESQYFDELLKLGIPYMMFNRKHKNGGNFVEIDNYQAGYLGAQYLVSKDHTDIHFFSGELEKSTFLNRYKGFCEALDELNIKYSDSNISITKQKPKLIEQELIKVLSVKNKPTAIFAATDMIALTLIDCLQKMDYRIPEDIAIIGIDNTETLRHSSLNLTSIGPVEGEHLSSIAVEQLFKMIEEGEQNEFQRTIPCKLYERGTV